MRLIPSDPDVETIVGRIRDGSLDLQPDFQRGAVWSRPKQRLLVDSIIRGWYVPPVHVVRTSEDRQTVLDGQQRLNSIFQFVNGVFPIDGRAEPFDREIELLDGVTYHHLTEQARRRFDRFTVRVFEVVDYAPEEPYELFYRLNQPTPLTSAEKRNAFFGAARAQVAELTAFAESVGMTPERIGFTNARLAFEDVVARFLWTLETGTLDEKVTSARVTERYRRTDPFDGRVMQLAAAAIERFFGLPSLDGRVIRFNKAMLHSWLCFTARAVALSVTLDPLTGFVPDVEIGRTAIKGRGTIGNLTDDHRDGIAVAFAVLNDRATSRVNDVSSVLLRDAVLWALYSEWYGVAVPAMRMLAGVLFGAGSERRAEADLLEVASLEGWSRLP